MEKNALVEELKNLVQNEDTLMISRDVNELKVRFDDFILEEERKDQVAQLEANEKGENYESTDFKPLKDEFFEIYNAYKLRRKDAVDARNRLEADNIKEKKSLISRLKEVIEKEENIGLAYNAYKEIHEKWKSIGDIARDKRDEIQAEYSKLLEDFFYNMKIYRELKDHDLKRNQQLKIDVIAQLDQLQKNESIREVENALKALQNEWEEIGPVANEMWEELKTSYWTKVREIYERINVFYDERRNSLQENLNKKKEILTEAAAIVSNKVEYTSVKLWEESTQKLLDLQEKWKSIGFGPRKENEQIWKEFRKISDEFFTAKKAFFGTIQDKFSKIAEAKQKLIDQAKSFESSTDWKITADKLILLQKQWKSAGHAGQKLEQKLWTEFRAACDAFFSARQKHFEDQDKELEVNLIAKQEIIKKIDAYTLAGDKKQALKDLKAFTNEFNSAGRVPMKQKDEIYNAYKRAMDDHYKQLKLEGSEKDTIMFEARIDTLAASPDAQKLFSKEKSDIRQQIEVLKSDILQLENNLGFFANSKGADALKKEVEGKINLSKEKIENLKLKMRMIPNE